MRIRLEMVIQTMLAVVALNAVFAQSSSAAFIYLAAKNLSPGHILEINGVVEDSIYARPANNLTSFTSGPKLGTPGTAANPSTMIYYCNAINEKRIYCLGDGVIYTHRTYVREVAFGPGPALYFSESSGATADGKIYRLNAAMVPVLYYTVRLGQVGGFWAGHFAFSPAGRLFISSGNIVRARIWACPLGPAAPVPMYRDRGPILGFCVTDAAARTFYFTNGTPQLRRGIFGGPPPAVVFVSPKRNNYCDVLVSDIQITPNG